MPNQVVEFDTRGRVATIRLNRPAVHNAIDEAVMRGLEEIIDELERAADTTVIVLTARGTESFCSGGDIKYFATLDTREKVVAMSIRMQRILNRLSSGPRAVIAAINGRALGGGCEILTACHFRIAASTATFRFVQAANGITTGWGGGARLFQLVGRANALSLLLTADPFDAPHALRIGVREPGCRAGRTRPGGLCACRFVMPKPARRDCRDAGSCKAQLPGAARSVGPRDGDIRGSVDVKRVPRAARKISVAPFKGVSRRAPGFAFGPTRPRLFPTACAR